MEKEQTEKVNAGLIYGLNDCPPGGCKLNCVSKEKK